MSDKIKEFKQTESKQFACKINSSKNITLKTLNNCNIITQSMIHKTVILLKRNTAPGHHNITTEMLKNNSSILLKLIFLIL